MSDTNTQKTAEAPKSANATKVYDLKTIKADPNNKAMNILATLGFIGLIIAFFEKKDQFVRYTGFEFGIMWLGWLLLTMIPLVNLLSGIYALASLVFWIIGLMKVINGERYDLPLFSDLALKAMSMF